MGIRPKIVGLKVEGFKKAKIGDLVESFSIEKPKRTETWHPKGGIFLFTY
jgi:hypothetical protein